MWHDADADAKLSADGTPRDAEMQMGHLVMRKEAVNACGNKMRMNPPPELEEGWVSQRRKRSAFASARLVDLRSSLHEVKYIPASPFLIGRGLPLP